MDDWGRIIMSKSFFEIAQYHNDAALDLEKNNIKELVTYERYCRDNGLFDEMKDCYSDESRVRITWFDGDGKEFVERFHKMGTGAKHKINTAFVWMLGDKAICEVTTLMMGAYMIIDGVQCSHTGWARLLYRVEKETGVWRIKGLDCIYERDTLVPVIPVANFSIEPEKINKYRESYKCLCYTLELQGLPANQELPGDDRPETVAALYEEAGQWLSH